jgi:proton glutamate symport protein
MKHGYPALATISLAALLHVLTAYVTPMPDVALVGSRWLAIAGVGYWAFKQGGLTPWIMFSILLGAEIGLDFPQLATDLQVLNKVFMRLIKMIIAPLLFGTLVVGIAGHADIKQVGRMGWKSLLYFEVVTTLALFIGLVAINISQAGRGIHPADGTVSELPKIEPKTWQDHITDIFPENIAKSVANGEVLQIVVFSVLFAIGLSMLRRETAKPMLDFAESLSHAMFKVTNIIMYFAPFGVGGAMAATVAKFGASIFINLFTLLATLYVALFAFVVLVLIPIALYLKIPLKRFAKAISEPVSIAFATASSEAALPSALTAMERFGVPNKIVSFVLPTGYTFNLDGTTLYLSLASVFVAQALGSPIAENIGSQLLMCLTLMLTSKGVAGVRSASLVILVGTATSLRLETWPILAIYGIDALMDMARTAVNVTGNCLASVVIAKWEGEFGVDEEHLLED